MKKTIIIIFSTLFLLHTNCYAQPVKGKRMIGGIFSIYGTYGGTDAFKSNMTNIDIEPTFGYFLSDKVSVGGIIGYNYNKYHTKSLDTFSKNAIIGIDSRQHFKLLESIAFYLQEDLKYSIGSRKYIDATNDQKVKTGNMFLGISPGLLFFPSPKIGVEAGFGSLYFQLETETDDAGVKRKQNNFGLKFDMTSLYFGFRFYF